MREPQPKPTPVKPEPEGRITDRAVSARLINAVKQPDHVTAFWRAHAPDLADPRTVGPEEEWLRRYRREHERCTWLLNSGRLAGEALRACQRLYERELKLQSLEGDSK